MLPNSINLILYNKMDKNIANAMLLRLNKQDQIEALKDLKEMASMYGYDISNPAKNDSQPDGQDEPALIEEKTDNGASSESDINVSLETKAED